MNILNSKYKCILFLFFLSYRGGNCLHCFECSSLLKDGESDYCSNGKEEYLRKVRCTSPSVCATYILIRDQIGYTPTKSVHRGCQGIRYGATCEDIFNDLRRSGTTFPGYHECSTCNEDFCNKSERVLLTFSLILLSSIVSFLS